MSAPELQVNGHRYEVHSPVGTTLAETLRDELTLTGTKVACGEGHCGACTVLVDGTPTLSCITLVHAVGNAKVTTIEGVRDHPMVDAFVRTDALQCGFCTPGQIMQATGLLLTNPKPTEADIRRELSGNLCKCSAYHNIIASVQYASDHWNNWAL